MDKITVVDLGLEGGGVTIYGNQEAGSWSFWTKVSSIGMDENDHEEWTSWTTEPVADLISVLPAEWPRFFPVEIHPAFRDWFRVHYEKACSMMREDIKKHHLANLDHEWRGMLYPSGEGTTDRKG
jgi:hypothetical protein